MAAQVTVKVEGIQEAIRKLGPEKAREPVDHFLDRCAIFTQSRARSHVQEKRAIDTGRTINSIAWRKSGDREREVGPNTAHAEIIEKGRRAGKMPPAGVLLPWMQRHGIAPEMEFVIRRAIGRRGIEPRPYMAPAAKETEAFIRSSLPILANELEAAYGRHG